jgi:outer membrane protein OmpA-like peptidoglycan-associated protein
MPAHFARWRGGDNSGFQAGASGGYAAVMATDDPPPTEEFDPDKTLFFARRKQHVNLLPFVVAGILVLGSGALITWAFTHSDKQIDEDAVVRRAVADATAKRPLISASEAASLENPPTGPAKELAGPAASVAAASSSVSQTPPPPLAASPTPAAEAAANPPAPAADANAPLNFDVDDPNNAAVRAEVLQRIDLMPNITATSKDKLYASVDHARKMGRVLTFPFEKGETTVHAGDIDRLKQQVQKPEIKQLLDDPTVIFVVLGYADPKGNDKVNAEISASRARSVMDALRDKCGFQNVMHSVAMGGSTLFSKQDAEKNRVVELWAVVP